MRDIAPAKKLEELLGKAASTTRRPSCYGDNNNWFAAWAFWQLKIYGRRDVRIGRRPQEMAGGRPRSEHGQAGVAVEDLLGERARSVAARVPA